MKSKRSAIGLTLASVLALVGCSSDSDGDQTPSSAEDSAAEASADEASADEASADQASADEASADEASADEASAPAGVINVGVPLDAITFDPHRSTTGPMMTYLTPLYDSILRRTPDGSVEPAVAAEWRYVDDEQRQLELTLRDDVTFWDGGAVDAEAVKVNLEDARDAGGPFSGGLAALESVEVVDDRTVTLNLSAAVPNIESVLSSPVGMLVEPSMLGSESLGSNPAGSGPYEVDPATQPGTTYVYTARDDGYWNPEAYGPETLNLLVLSDTDARLNALISGQVDATVVFVQQASTAAGAGGGVELLSQPLNTYALALLDRNGAMVPALGDVRVRQALNYAVDREAIAEALAFGYGRPSSQIFPETSPAFSESAAETYPYDPERANELLAEAGYGDGLTIPVFTEARFASYVEAVDGFLRDVGVTLDITTADSGMIPSWSSGEYPATTMIYGESDPLVAINTWALPESPNNPFNAELPNVATLQEQLSTETDQGARAEIYQQISEALTTEGWFLTTHVVDVIYGVNTDKIQGVEMYVGNSVPYVYGWDVVGQ